jgi:hypothetical protein
VRRQERARDEDIMDMYNNNQVASISSSLSIVHSLACSSLLWRHCCDLCPMFLVLTCMGLVDCVDS